MRLVLSHTSELYKVTSLGTNLSSRGRLHWAWPAKAGISKFCIRLKRTGLVLVQRTSISMSSSVPRPCEETEIISTIQNTCRIKNRYYSSVVQYNRPREVGEKMSKGSQESGAWSGKQDAWSVKREAWSMKHEGKSMRHAKSEWRVKS